MKSEKSKAGSIEAIDQSGEVTCMDSTRAVKFWLSEEDYVECEIEDGMLTVIGLGEEFVSITVKPICSNVVCVKVE